MWGLKKRRRYNKYVRAHEGRAMCILSSQVPRAIVHFYSKGNPLQACFRGFHVLVMQRLLFKNELNDLHFSYNKTFFLQGTLDGLPFE